MMVYSSLHVLGKSGYELLIDQSIDKAKAFADMIDAHPDFELITAPILSLLTYRYNPASIQASFSDPVILNERLDKLTKAIQKQQREAGKSFVSRTRLSTKRYDNQCLTVFRVVIANPLTTVAHLAGILEEQAEIAQAHPLYAELLQSHACTTE